MEIDKKIEETAAKQKNGFKLSDTLILLIIMAVIFAFFTLANRQFIAYENISSMLRNMVITGILALGLTPLMIARGLDISFGSNLSLTTVIVALLYTAGVNIWISLITGIIISTSIGFINGILIEVFDLIPIILTLGMMAILQSLALVASNAKTVAMLTDDLYYFASKSLFKIPMPVFILIAIIFIFWFLMSFTKIGRTIYVIGANPNAAFLSGIKIKKVRILLYTVMGFMVGISSVIMISLTGVGYPYHGVNLPLPTLSAVLLGGISLAGGSGTILGTLIGVLIVTMIFNGLSVMNLPSYYIQIFQGLTLILFVASYEIRNRKRSQSR